MNNTQILDDVTSTCNLLGYIDEGGKYLKSLECENCLLDLIRFLRKDSSQFVILRKLGQIDLVQTDLVPIMKQHCANNERLFDIVLRLFVMLTNPALILFNEKIPNTIEEKQIFLEINEFLFHYKLILSQDIKFWSAVGKRMALILKKDSNDRLEEHRIMLERLLILIRNIINVPNDTFLDQESLYSSVQDNLIEVTKESGILDLIIYMCQTPNEYQFCFHLLEIISSLLREQTGEFLAKSVELDSFSVNYNRRNNYEIQLDQEELKELLELKNRMQSKTLHSYNRFKESTYVVKNLRSLSNQDVIYHKTPDDVKNITFDANKNAIRKAKNRRPMEDDSKYLKKSQPFHRSSLKIRNILKDFCSFFISNCYNSFMSYVRSNLERKIAQENDETYYLWSCQFFMEFNRFSKADANFIIETFSIETFHYLHTLIQHHLDMFVQEKKDFRVWSKRLHLALKAYRELLFTLHYIGSSKTSELQPKVKDIINKIFYEIEYRELLLELISGFNEIKMPPSYLKDLIETNHVFLKMLESFMKKTENFLVQKKSKKKSVKKLTGLKKTPDNLELIWTETSSILSLAIQGLIELPQPEEHSDLIPIDSLSEKSFDDQKFDVLSRIHKFLICKKPLKAVALFRNAREVWSSDLENPFGFLGMSLEEELQSMRDIFFSDLWPEILIEESEKVEENNQDNIEEPQCFENECKVSEQPFEFTLFICKYAHYKIIKAYCSVLKNYDLNSDFLNHAIIKLYHRIAWDCQMPVLFFQLSLFRIFQKCLTTPISNVSQSILEIKKFAEFIIRKFIESKNKNPKILIELLFWKNKKDMYEIEEGYGSYSIKTSSKSKKLKKSKGKSESLINSDSDLEKIDENFGDFDNALISLNNYESDSNSILSDESSNLNNKSLTSHFASNYSKSNEPLILNTVDDIDFNYLKSTIYELDKNDDDIEQTFTSQVSRNSQNDMKKYSQNYKDQSIRTNRTKLTAYVLNDDEDNNDVNVDVGNHNDEHGNVRDDNKHGYEQNEISISSKNEQLFISFHQDDIDNEKVYSRARKRVFVNFDGENNNSDIDLVVSDQFSKSNLSQLNFESDVLQDNSEIKTKSRKRVINELESDDE